MSEPRLRIKPITLRAANAYVAAHHRHHPPTRGHKLSIAVMDVRDELCGVAILGRPVARALDDGTRIEVLRVCTDGTPNACSMLYGAARRVATTRGDTWDRPGRPRDDAHPTGPKVRWAA